MIMIHNLLIYLAMMMGSAPSSITANTIQRGICQTSLGSIGYQMSKCTSDDELSEPSIICFHSTPRSSDEFVDMIPFLTKRNRTVIAIDALGYGISSNPTRSCTFEELSDAYLEVMRELGVLDGVDGTKDNTEEEKEKTIESKKKVILMGSLLGNFPVLALASRYPDLVSACILVNLYFFPQSESNTPEEEEEAAPIQKPIPDPWELKEDGTMLSQLWTKRSSWADPELNIRIIQNELTYLVNRRRRLQEGITIQDLDSVHMEFWAKGIACPVLCIKGKESLAFFDSIGMKGTQQFKKGCECLRDYRLVDLDGVGSNINLVNQMAEEVSVYVIDFLDQVEN